ncbi:RNA polymerase sigma factor [Dysgonomonas macrotermitis]|uniref:RNA polymerase sigma-70 factor, ECF subfamily n=1 Tax=Dysgonomonas macrotermitis TaxID=1346286 RepID=A0A1M4WSQ4_9BACT|nr:sigma-70 family RNA polymerase sigma factor [Dysgonomonas macrotermitis]SHE84259.1 RNA polymerase sigma-70 factor, ECF subfamily [Dysgonomonas macrotermitis]
MEELQLIEGCKKEDRKAQQLVYEKYARVMYGICLRYSSDRDAAQDLLQDGFIKVFLNINSFENKGSFEGWMKRIFVNLALENIRKEKTKKLYNDEDIENISDIDIIDEATGDIDRLTEDELLKMVQELPKGYRSVFNLYAIEDYSHKEISEMLGIAEGTSRSQYIRARALLQEKIRDYFHK